MDPAMRPKECPGCERAHRENERLRAELRDLKSVLREAELVMERKEARIEAALAIAVSLAVSHPHLGRPLLAALKGEGE